MGQRETPNHCIPEAKSLTHLDSKEEHSTYKPMGTTTWLGLCCFNCIDEA